MTERCSLRVLIADDELLARKRLQRLLAALDEVEVVAECDRGDQVLRALEATEVDLALLDIQMPGLTGLDVSGLLNSDGPEVVFTTAHPEYALEAFDLGAADYLVKPIAPSRLRQAIERVRQRRAHAAAPTLPRLALEGRRGELRLVAPKTIAAALFDGELVTVHLSEGEALLTDLTLQQLQRRLPPDLLHRVHRRALLNLDHVERLVPLPSGGYRALTNGGVEVPISRQAARDLRKRLAVVVAH